MSSPKKPTLAIISHTLRRDLEEPLRHFSRLKLVHLYHDATYQDLRNADLASTPIRYQDAQDLMLRLRELKPDIIQGPEPYASRVALKNAWAVYRYCRQTGTPYFFPMFENRPPRIKFGPLVGAFMEWVLGRYAQHAAGVIALNEGVVRNLKAAGVPPRRIERLVWGTWGINTSEFTPKRGAKADRPTLFFVGRISAKKGLDDVLAAWERILGDVPTARLVVGGPALDADSQGLLAQLRATPAAEYVGPIKNAELHEYFQRAWVTIAPSVTTKIWEEQVGMVLLQSLSTGTPVVSTRSGAIPEYVGEGNGALLVAEHDVAGLAEAATTLLRDATQRTELGSRGRRYIQDRYEVKQSVKACEDYVLRLLGNAQ